MPQISSRCCKVSRPEGGVI